jgi:PIN domain nuclease of toxin-antitoxin system
VILLDTHALLWLAYDREELGRQARETIKDNAETASLAIPAILFWELGVLIEKRRYVLPMPLADFAVVVADQMGIKVIPVDTKIAIESGSLPPGLHGDPGDRLIVATARTIACPLLTSDSKLLAYAAAGHLQAIDARL